MILLLKQHGATIVAQSWAAVANEDSRVEIHCQGSIIVTLVVLMPEFLRAAVSLASNHIWDLRYACKS